MADGTLSAGTVSLAVKPDTSGFGAKLKSSVTSQVKGTGEHIGGMLRDGLKAMAGPIAAVGAGFAIEKIVSGSIDSFESLAGSVKQLQRISGGTVEQVSGLRGAMQLAGVDTSKLSTAMTIFTKNVGQAGTNAKKAATMNAVFGQSIKDAHGNIKPMAELLPGLADRFKAMPDGAQKTALAMQLFGRQGAAMIPFLNKGSDGIKDLTAKAKEMGLALDDNSMKSFAEAKKSQREFDASMQGLQVTIGQALMPIMEAMVGVIRDKIVPWFQVAVKWVKQHEKAFKDLGERIKSFVTPIFDAVAEALKKVVGWIIKNRDWLIALGVAIGAGVLAFKLYEGTLVAISLAQKAWATGLLIFQLLTGQATLAQIGFNTALLANPIGLIIAAVAALVAGLVWFFTQTKIGQQLWSQFTGFLQNSVKAIGGFFVGLWKGIVNGWNGMVNGIKGVFNFIGGLIKGYINGWIWVIESAINFIIGGLNGLVKGANTILGPLGDAIHVNIKVGEIPNLSIPRLAKGGVVPATPGGRQVVVGEGGKSEAIIPLDRLQAMMNNAGTSNRPIYADGIGLLGWVRQAANGEAKLVFNTEISNVLRGSR